MKFQLKQTTTRNIGLLVKSTFSLFLFMIGLSKIAEFGDQSTVLFLTLIWCYIFLTHFRFNPRLIYQNKHGDIEEY